MEGMTPHQEAMLTEALKGINQLIPQMSDTKAGVENLRKDVQQVQIQQARHDERVENLEGHVDNLGKKLRHHEGNSKIHSTWSPPPAPAASDHWSGATVRWRFVATVTGAVLGITGLLSLIASYWPK